MKLLLLITFLPLTLLSLGQNMRTTIVKEIPSISIYDLYGDTTNLTTLSKGKITFIDFWFVPCGPCFSEMHMLHKLYAKYKSNSNISFLTITLTDSSFVRPLVENKNTSNNETYEYFKTLTNLDTFKLPVYFITGGNSKMISFKKTKNGFSGHGEPRIKDNPYYPGNIFGFSGYPTILIFNTKAELIYNNTGFIKDNEKKQKREIEELINANL